MMAISLWEFFGVSGPEKDYFYHGTTLKNAKQIMRTGLKAQGAGRPNWPQSRSGSVYLTSKDNAEYWSYGRQPHPQTALIKIDKKGISQKHLRADWNFSHSRAATGRRSVKNAPRDANFEYDKPISPKYLKLMRFKVR